MLEDEWPTGRMAAQSHRLLRKSLRRLAVAELALSFSCSQWLRKAHVELAETKMRKYFNATVYYLFVVGLSIAAIVAVSCASWSMSESDRFINASIKVIEKPSENLEQYLERYIGDYRAPEEQDYEAIRAFLAIVLNCPEEKVLGRNMYEYGVAACTITYRILAQLMEKRELDWGIPGDIRYVPDWRLWLAENNEYFKGREMSPEYRRFAQRVKARAK